MKHFLAFLLVIGLLLTAAGPVPAIAAPVSARIPTFSIVSVVADTSVTIQTRNFPANDTFAVLMNYMGTRGVNGIRVDTISSGRGGSFRATFNVPNALKGQHRIAIRLQSVTGSRYFAYNWFYNNTTGDLIGGGNGNGYVGYPTFRITGVERNKTVTIETNNLPSRDRFVVRMGPIGTRGIGGYRVTSFESGSGGTQTYTFNIPAQLKGARQISIRLESNTGSGYFAYNWFFNNTTSVALRGGESSTPTSGSTTAARSRAYRGYPTFSIVSVVRNQTVTIETHNLPPKDRFVVRMGRMGSRGINGVRITSFETGSGGTQTYTFNIPPQLSGQYQIAIRMDSNTGTGYFAYNWFFNNTTP